MSEKTTPEAESYTREELIRHAQALFGVNPEVLAGAMHGRDQAEWTVGQAKQQLDRFLKRKVN